MATRPSARAGLGMALAVVGCAQTADWQRRDAWLDYLGGDDLRASCDVGTPDRLRLITAPHPQPAQTRSYRAIDIIGTATGGAVIVQRTVRPSDVADQLPQGHWRETGERLVLTPQATDALFYWLDRLGLFTPPPMPPNPEPEAPSWLISGCRDGVWFMNASVDAAAIRHDLRIMLRQRLPESGAVSDPP